MDCKRQWLQFQSVQQEVNNFQIQNLRQQQIQTIAETDCFIWYEKLYAIHDKRWI